MKYLLLIILLIIILIIVYIVNTITNLKILEKETIKCWNLLKEKINDQFSLAINVKTKVVTNVIKKYHEDLTQEELMDLYLELENLHINKEFNINKEIIDELKTNYNNIVLKYNNVVKMFPSYIVAKICHFKSYIWFRNKK